ncbi:response regulator transcription factor [Flavobacterium sp. NG2]|uniref:response regulator transcription factor n=1 Tax=Flavobacterium sp. NG2 TaxID=3097547 RepID=UPI002A82FD64|nr:response regulator transcription factor [Flavobacterium sp. NG2]WPR72886.1 response regulator transcription factor [Flavobacterium sp. NG2]
MEEKIRIHLADDHHVLIDGMKNLLNTISNYDVVGFSLDGTTLYDDVKANKTHILILDISMPKKDGLEVLKEFNEKGFPCKVIILSSYDDLKIIKEVMNLGASGYLSKRSASENIVEAIQSVHNGEKYYCDLVRESIFAKATQNIPNSIKQKNTIAKSLTEREIEIITLISLEYSGKEMSEILSISVNTVETHRKNILKKLKAKNTISIVKFAIKNNLITD